jgi:DNA-binding beta-propeller fold protein YncE
MLSQIPLFDVIRHVILLPLRPPLLLSATTVTTIAGGSSGRANGVGAVAQFDSPRAICISNVGGYLYVADYNSGLIRRIVIATATVTTFAGGGTSPTGVGTNAQFNSPKGIACDDFTGDVYVGDTNLYRIAKINTAGTNLLVCL